MVKVLALTFLAWGSAWAQQPDYPFRNPDLPLEIRINDLIARLTLDEKVQLMKHEAPAIPRLGIPAYNWWNEEPSRWLRHSIRRLSGKWAT